MPRGYAVNIADNSSQIDATKRVADIKFVVDGTLWMSEMANVFLAFVVMLRLTIAPLAALHTMILLFTPLHYAL
jgi:hypothetical protein